ncbi:uncharacterized protein LOC106132541 [Amyelois transitella]|uniref:uncharacterized protein LOC106132541 n=1 Tax=Amyelois transitella TaxID=680683 RepID=UPI00298FFFB7|nr:uncharacterized protein LOC106132541 [Amyelois transitella]
MKISQSHHVRIRDNNPYGVDIEAILKYIETQYDTDIRSLPQWKELIKRLHVTTTDCKRIIQNANRRKLQIIDKLYRESTRLSPFQLTDMLARTASRWKMLEDEARRKKIPFKLEPEMIPTAEASEGSYAEQSEVESGHPNTEVSQYQDFDLETLPQKSEPESETPICISHLPVLITTNPHEFVGPSYSVLSRRSEQTTERNRSVTMKEYQEWNLLPESTLVKSLPKEIIIKNDSLEEQFIKFSIVNCGTEYLHIKYVCVTEKSHFRYAKVIPKTPTKLYPGLAVVFKLFFKVVQNEYDFASSLYFRIGQIVLDEGSTLNSLCIPVKTNYTQLRNVSVSEAVYLPAIYPWQIGEDFGYPTNYINISVLDNFSYHVHISKRQLNFDDLQDSRQSLGEIAETQSNPTMEIQSKTKQTANDIIDEVESFDSAVIISSVVFDVVEASMDAFWIEKTYVHLRKSNLKIPVHLTKVEFIGSHHACYDVDFFDSNTEKWFFTKTVRVYAEVLPHPVEIQPPILDMTNSPVFHGFCEDKFFIANNHKSYSVTVKIKLTTKMKKLLRIYPMEVVIPQRSNVSFDVRFCSPGLLMRNFDDLVHFTFKIVVTGFRSIYYKVPPFFFEIIAPCLNVYEKVYKKKVET